MGELKISFLNVGHGDFIYCETPYKERMIIDCGSGEVVPSEFLKNISTIHELQISHPHTDHFDDIVGISKKNIMSFRCINPEMFADNLIGWRNNDQDKIKKLKELDKSTVTNNDAITIGSEFNHVIKVPKIDSKDPNTASLITILSYKEDKILLTGDLPSKSWEEMLTDETFQNSIKGTTLLKASHHGREEGFYGGLFDFIKPTICIISDKPLDKDNENTDARDKYGKAIKDGGGGLEFFKIIDGKSVGKRYVLTTRNDNSIFVKISENGLYIRTCTEWLDESGSITNPKE